MKNKIRIDFILRRKINSNIFKLVVPMSPHRYLYYVDIEKESDINEELAELIKEAYDR